MDVEFKILDNGLTLLHDQMDVHSTSVGVYIGSGSSEEAKDECGIAHMLEHMAFKGTENRNAEKIAREIEDVGGDICIHKQRGHSLLFKSFKRGHKSWH